MSCGSSSGRLVWESLGPFSSFPSCAVVFGASVGSEEWISKHPIYSHCLFIHSHQAPTSFSFPFQTLFWGNWLSRRAWPVPVVFQHHSALHSAVMCSRTSWKFAPVVVLSLGRGQSPGIVWITYIKSRWLAEFWYLVYYLHDEWIGKLVVYIDCLSYKLPGFLQGNSMETQTTWKRGTATDLRWGCEPAPSATLQRREWRGQHSEFSAPPGESSLEEVLGRARLEVCWPRCWRRKDGDFGVGRWLGSDNSLVCGKIEKCVSQMWRCHTLQFQPLESWGRRMSSS